MRADEVVASITGIASDRGYVLLGPVSSGRSRLAQLWIGHRGRLVFGMALDFSEAAGYYGLYTAMTIFVFSSATGAVPVSDAALPVYFLIANLGALLGGIVVSFGLDRLGRKPTVTFSYLLAALSMLGVAAAAGAGSAGAVLAGSPSRRSSRPARGCRPIPPSPSCSPPTCGPVVSEPASGSAGSAR